MLVAALLLAGPRIRCRRFHLSCPNTAVLRHVAPTWTPHLQFDVTFDAAEGEPCSTDEEALSASVDGGAYEYQFIGCAAGLVCEAQGEADAVCVQDSRTFTATYGQDCDDEDNWCELSASLRCVNDACRYLAGAGDKCLHDDDCLDAFGVSTGRACVDGVCSGTATTTCVERSGVVAETCAGAQLCYNGTCAELLAKDAACPDGEEGKLCVPGTLCNTVSKPKPDTWTCTQYFSVANQGYAREVGHITQCAKGRTDVVDRCRDLRSSLTGYAHAGETCEGTQTCEHQEDFCRCEGDGVGTCFTSDVNEALYEKGAAFYSCAATSGCPLHAQLTGAEGSCYVEACGADTVTEYLCAEASYTLWELGIPEIAVPAFMEENAARMPQGHWLSCCGANGCDSGDADGESDGAAKPYAAIVAASVAAAVVATAMARM